ncbi:hypothetical protein EZS27_010669 [termite gut metagenome]|uniref:Uncharacterized protein n=1 Tax=termite gut metagenome TaxID=433724 RepID=A0A5J4S893_9ZZZZ
MLIIITCNKNHSYFVWLSYKTKKGVAVVAKTVAIYVFY